MANEVELAPILSAACSLKHATDMKKAFSTQDEAFDKAKQLGLTPDQAARDVTPTPSGRFALYDARKGELPNRTPGSHLIFDHSFKLLAQKLASQSFLVSLMIQELL